MCFYFGKNALSIWHPSCLSKVCVATNEVLRFSCAASFGAAHFLMKGDYRMKKLSCLFALVVCIYSLSACASTNEDVDLVSLPAIEYTGADFEAVVAELENAGFTNIRTKAIDDLTSNRKMDEGVIESITINGSDDFLETEQFESDAEIIITYHIIPKISLPLSPNDIQEMEYDDIGQLLIDAGYSNVFLEELYDLDPDEIENDYVNEITIDGESVFSENESIPFDAEIRIICHYPFEKYTVELHIDFIPNLIFSKYDVNLSLDGEKQYTMEHGIDANYIFSVKEGTHTFTFADSTAPSVKGEVVLDVMSDVDASYKIYCQSDKITVDEIYVDYIIELADNEVKILSTESNFLYKNYTEVISTLEGLGFTNIVAEPVYDIIWGITDAESTSNVSIGGSDQFKRGDVFPDDIEIVVTYHMPYEDDPTKQTEQSGAVQFTSTPKVFDIDKDLVVAMCERDDKFTSMYNIVFAEYDESGTPINFYAFDSYDNCINPRTMGEEFNAIGDLPSWFYVGATVHVKANLSSGGGLSTSNCSVTPPSNNSDSDSTTRFDTENKTDEHIDDNINQKYYLKNVAGKDIFNNIVTGESVTNSDSFGDSEFYFHGANVNNISIEIDTYGENGEVLIISVMDLYDTGKTEIFYKVLDDVFSGDDLAYITKWFSANVGTESSIKVADANIILRLTVSGYPILYIVDDEHIDWI